MSSTDFDTPHSPLPTTIFVVRHAEVHNPTNILYGRLPRFRLSRKGWEQSAATARFLSTRRVDAIYTSPLLRARQTAAVLQGSHAAIRVHTASALLEVRTSYQGESNSILKKGFSFYEPKHHPDDESMEDVWLRIRRFLQRLVRRHAGSSVIAVSHADPITIMRVGLLRLPFTNESLHGVVYPERASITELVIGPDGPTALAYFNPSRP